MKKIFGLSNFKKAYRYCRKNGIGPAFWAALERVAGGDTTYEKRLLSAAEREMQRDAVWDKRELFSVLVPAYETDVRHFHEMIASVQAQTYGDWELVIADASPTDKLTREMGHYKDSRIRYLRLKENKGISENTNAALAAAAGSYIGLLDHDDVLEPDALYRMMEAIQSVVRETGIAPQMLYSDEDKGDGEMKRFYEPHRKVKFNLDLILSNNYICHFLVMKRELIQSLGLRGEFDGAQDHDLVLRAARRLWEEPERIVHVPHILYHWRCHTGSTAENPESKRYAYEAGRRAVADFCRAQGWQVRVIPLPHLGFFRVAYTGDIFRQRTDLGAVGGRLIRRGRIAGGAYGADGTLLYAGLPKSFSGYMHRAVLQQDAAGVDLRNITVREELRPLLEQVRSEEHDPAAAAVRFGAEAAKRGYRILWDPFHCGTDG